jgi:hypothetical protein
MATVIIPDGSTKPVKIPKNCQIDIIEHPTGTKGYVLLHCTNPPEIINYPLPTHPHPTVYNLPVPVCNVTNIAADGTPPGSSVDFIAPYLPVTEL